MKNFALVFVAALSFASVGCKKKAAGGSDCSQAVNHSMELSKGEMQKMGTDDKMMAKMVELGIQHCKDDKWSNDALKCMVDAKTMADSQGCYGKLSKDQQDKMNKSVMEMATPTAGSADAAGSAGSADAAGSAGSAAAGSDAGSAAGSAAAGSAAAGSGSAGSAAAPK